MPQELPRTSSASTPWMLKQAKVPCRLGLSNIVSQRTVCKDNRNADTMTTRLKATRLNSKNIH